MKPIKPKRLSKTRERLLGGIATRSARELCHLTVGDVRAILAALEYERQRAEQVQTVLKRVVGDTQSAWDEWEDGEGVPLSADIARALTP